jgi:hypothetical protein
MIKTAVGILGISLLSACALDAGKAVPADESVGHVSQPVETWTWMPHPEMGRTIGIADITGPPPSTTVAYQWFDTGRVCVGPRADICYIKETYIAPNNDFAAIRGIGVAKNTGRVYTWYADGKVSAGTYKNLTAYNSKTLFNVPSKPGGGVFTMDELIEVDNSDNGEWYYYWRDAAATDGRIYRTTGTSVTPTAYTGLTLVRKPYPNAENIVGIAFGGGSPAALLVYYGTVNGSATAVSSQNSLVLQ